MTPAGSPPRWCGGPAAAWTGCSAARGARRQRPDRPLRVGDRVDFWTVTGLEAGRRLVLSPDTRLPGHMDLELEVHPEGDGSRLVLRHGFTPDGPAGRLYGEATRLGDVALYAWMHRKLVLAAQARTA
ncbi:DUF2867 domain-containing protein [Pedococcus ginsenosidimutans]|uniref:DUF2867 domain-containing protein n=1 Tax=Pedococcus ginsenosidimutans TaxID=490570 RepID=UPI0031F16614